MHKKYCIHVCFYMCIYMYICIYFERVFGCFRTCYMNFKNIKVRIIIILLFFSLFALHVFKNRIVNNNKKKNPAKEEF